MSGTLPLWLERWLGLAPGAGEGTAWRLQGHWPWPSWATLLAVAVAAAAIVAIYLRENRQASRRWRLALAAMRLGLLALVLLMIAQVELLLERTGLPYVAVLLDDSRSMTTVDSYPEPLRKTLADRVARAQLPGGRALSRWNLARALLAADDARLLERLAEDYKLRLYFLTGVKASRSASPAGMVEELRGAEAAGASTRLGAATRAVLDDLRGTTPAAVVLLTDGINTEGPSLAEAAAYARRRGVPLVLVGLGSDQPVRELRLGDLSVGNDVVFVNDLVRFGFRLTGTGLAGKKVGIVLRRNEQAAVLARTEVVVGPDGRPQDVQLLYRPAEVGRFRFTIQIEPHPDLPAVPAPLSRSIEVRATKIRVLLADGTPRFEYRFLRNMLRREATIELHTVLQDADLEPPEKDRPARAGQQPAGRDVDADPEHAEEDRLALTVFPVGRDELFAYDAVILGDLNPALLGSAVLGNLADFVDQPDQVDQPGKVAQRGKGGSLLLLAGPKYMPQAFRETPLARIFPFDPATVRCPDPGKPLTEPIAVEPTELGLASPPMQLGDTPEASRTIWRNLPPLYWMVDRLDLKLGAQVLAEHATRTGPDGKHLPLVVLQYMGAGKVLFHATDETYRWSRGSGDLFFARYWVQMIRYLSRWKLAEGGRSARLIINPREYRAGDPVRLRVCFSDERLAPPEDNGVSVVLEQQGRRTEHVLERVEAGRGLFETTLRGLPPGAYHAWVAVPALPGRAPGADFSVAAPQGEMARVEMDAAAMRQAAAATKGHYYSVSEADRLPGDLPEGRQVPLVELPPLPLWNRWPVILLFLALLVGEWLLRKRRGMV